MLRAMNSGNVASGGAAASSSSGSRSGQAASTDSPPGFRPQAKPVPVKAMPKRPDAPPAKAFLPPSPLNNQPIIASPCSPSSQDTLPTSNSDIVVEESPQMVGAGATSKASAPLPATTWAAPFPPMPPAQPMPAASAAPIAGMPAPPDGASPNGSNPVSLAPTPPPFPPRPPGMSRRNYEVWCGKRGAKRKRGGQNVS